jgi:hypothetical protein
MLDIAVQHHPSRGHLLGGLVALGDHVVVTDPDPDGRPSAIRTYVECLRELPAAVTHRLVFQDDALPCAGFRELAEQAIQERPDALVAFFVPGTAAHGRRLREARANGLRWEQLPTSMSWTPTVALAWPRRYAEGFVPFADQFIARRRARNMATVGDDPVVGSFRRAEGIQVWATVPCLVEHPDTVPSLVKKRSYEGRYPARRAAVFIDQ